MLRVPSVLEDLGANRQDRNENKSFKCAFFPCISQSMSPSSICFAATGRVAGVLSLSFLIIPTWTQKEVGGALCNVPFCCVADMFLELHK